MTTTELDLRQVDSTVRTIGEHGYVLLENLLPAPTIDRMREALERLLHEEKARNLHPSGHQRVLHVLVKDPVFVDALVHPLVLAVWRRYLSEDLICSTFTANSLWPGATEQYWHADHPYWTLTPPWPSIPLSGQCIWFLDDFTDENGATAGIPGSHRADRLPDMGESWCDEGEILAGPAGSAIFADGAWWHTSRPNRTTALRSALLVTYTHTFCVPQEDMRGQLDALSNPSDLVVELLGGKQYQPRRDFPY
ncbi:phytanoyl-CoA dioxygenase family protein [Actinomadura terrae]|uniref:phytanoyl-CoA dioxygenase family protein n=1 Tax=Actinomadura terrae TaxID=604353 RepID=UPI001FA72191|nr:phytanoyl-CoA dioxygenase family protein [Actinomadura terrae]